MERMIRQERAKHGWSCEYVAAKIGVTPEAMRLMEVGKRNPSFAVLVKLEDLFECDYRYLFGLPALRR